MFHHELALTPWINFWRRPVNDINPNGQVNLLTVELVTISVGNLYLEYLKISQKSAK